MLISIAYAATLVQTRRRPLTTDWVMAVVAIYVPLTYPKFLAAMEGSHAAQVYVPALPLLLYILYRALVPTERWIRGRLHGVPLARLSAHPLSVGLILLVGAISWGPLWERTSNAPDRYRSEVAGQPALERVGYAEGFNLPLYRDLRRTIDSYLEPSDRIFDFTSEPGLFYWLMERDPSTRYYHPTSIGYRAELQEDMIDELEQSRPKLIVFDNNGDPSIHSLRNLHDIATTTRLYLVGQWILDNYRPLLTSHGHTLYLRRDLSPAEQPDLRLAEQPITDEVPFQTQRCLWGSAPSFLEGPGLPAPGATARPVNAGPARDRVSIVGWAADAATELPAREVIVTVDGKVVARTKPNVVRPDLLDFGLPKGFKRSGFEIGVKPGSDWAAGKLRVYGVARSGEVSQLVRQDGRQVRRTATLDGRRVRVDPSFVYGQLNSVTRDRLLPIDRPPGSQWSDYRWLELEAGTDGFEDGGIALYDRLDRPSPQREIFFETLERSSDRFVIPVGSCAQWHGYRQKELYLNASPYQEIPTVRLIR